MTTHLYVVGRTKKGKSKFLENLAHQLIAEAQGCGILDPHSDLIDDLLAYLHPHLISDPALRRRIVYFQPGRDDYLIPFNGSGADRGKWMRFQIVLVCFRRYLAGAAVAWAAVRR